MTDDPVILPWAEMQKKAERDGVDVMVYVNSMHAHVVRQRETIKRLAAREKELRDVLSDIALGARMMLEPAVAGIHPSLKRYAEEVQRVANGNLTALEKNHG